MKLEEFVKQTLLDITNGVSSAQAASPSWIAPGRVEGKKVMSPQMVSFEVAVTVSKEGGGSINIWSVAEAGGKASSEHTNKISFDVPVYFQARKVSGASSDTSLT
ncbi:trypco2 family protein [Kordiimonas marina]|uniref:trypco2 family protein n=1 Tax=Kordiimonas marina TaxID=2872312 RepID=UPI001FF30A11|nr:trypco2 family protein [Kordiimonas marina]MCJ9427922.1 hypothetical protein [Kordiimonas marina]